MSRSMTAFARIDHNSELGQFCWEIRSVNHRYLEPTFKLPDTLRSLETALRHQIKQSLHRGKIDCHLRFTPNEQVQSISINETLVSELNAAADHIHQIIGPGNALNALELMKWPGVIASPPVNETKLSEQALQAFALALKQVIETREREGAELKTFVLKRLSLINTIVADIRQKMPAILLRQQSNLQERIKGLQQDLDNDRLAQEIAVIAQKADTDEELDRLQAHTTEVSRVIDQQGPIGRRLDFLMQELNREANTLSSKSVVSETTSLAVELKVLIEQMREQIQNIE